MRNESRYKIPPLRAIQFFRRKIILWFRKNKRQYPWRETRDPYRVLMAEVMLRRTRADQVKPVYEVLFKKYPDAESMANANGNNLRRILYPLGLRWRVPAFRKIARAVLQKFGGRVPNSRQELTSLPGVGDYVAGAVLSIAFGKKEWMVDSNIVRVLKRYFGLNTSKEGRRDKHIVKLGRIYSSACNPRDANLAILDFAALICIPRNPRCPSCPIRNSCSYFNK